MYSFSYTYVVIIYHKKKISCTGKNLLLVTTNPSNFLQLWYYIFWWISQRRKFYDNVISITLSRFLLKKSLANSIIYIKAKKYLFAIVTLFTEACLGFFLLGTDYIFRGWGNFIRSRIEKNFAPPPCPWDIYIFV